MKICWDNLKDVILTKNGNFKNKVNKQTYTYMDKCKTCNEDYLTRKQSPSMFCSISCQQKTRSHSQHTKKLLSEVNKGRIFSESTRKKISENRRNKTNGCRNYGWKGGVNKDRIALFDTYASQIDFAEEVRPFYDNESRKLLEIRCSKCKMWFLPKVNDVKSRVRSLSGKKCGESRFYCSNTCKSSCEVYHKNPFNYINLTKKQTSCTHEELHIWSMEVIKRANNTCEICGDIAEHAHHIQPKKLSPFLALDPDNGIAVCKTCHYKYGHNGKCSLSKLANIVCV